MYSKFGIKREIIDLSKEVENEIKEEFAKIDKTEEENTLKVLMACQKYNLSDMHFGTTTGYGYGDVGRDTIKNFCRSIRNRRCTSEKSIYIWDTCTNSSIVCNAKT